MKIVFDFSTLILLSKTELLSIVSEDAKIINPKLVKAKFTAKDTFDAKLISALFNSRKYKWLG